MSLEKEDRKIHLVDTTVWIDFFNGNSSSQVDHLTKLLADRASISICGVITTELLQGIKSEKSFKQLEQYLRPLLYLDATRETHIRAAKINRKLRKYGVTIRKTIDCIIAAIAIENGCVLLHNDKDFDRIAEYYNLKTITFATCH